MLFTVHKVASKLTKIEAINLNKEESKALSEAMMEVTELYEVPLMNEKAMAWMNLLAVMCDVYVFKSHGVKTVDARNVTPIRHAETLPDFMRG